MLNSIYHFLARIGYPHPIHPTEVHMPIGLVVGAVIFSLIATIFKKERMASVPYYCIFLAFIWTFPTILFGYMDWQHFYGGSWSLPIKVKISLAPVLAALLLLSLLLGRKYGHASMTAIAAQILSLLCVVVVGYFGGEMVYGFKTSAFVSARFAKGEKVFDTHCFSCHPSGGNVIKPDKPLVGSPELESLDRFTTFIRHPKDNMPAFLPSQIPDEDMAELYSYIVNVLNKKER